MDKPVLKSSETVKKLNSFVMSTGKKEHSMYVEYINMIQMDWY